MKILIADDHEYNRELLGYIMEDEGHDYICAENGKEAYEKAIQDQGIDLVLMDVSMPVMDGIEATPLIKQDEHGQFIPIIFVTAMDDPEVLAKCLDAGGDDFVPKPINESVLLAKIKAHGRTRELNQSLHSAKKQLEYHKELMDREHEIVDRIFERGKNLVKTDCVNVRKYTSPMSMFNGDIVLETPSPSGGVYVLAGDFTGHGLAASIGTLPVTQIFYRLGSQQASLAAMAKEINQVLTDLLPSNMFFCAALCYLDAKGKHLSLWAGGMNDMQLLRKGSDVLEAIESDHMPLGILNDAEFDETLKILDLNCGDRLFIYSDGVNEAQNEAGEEFGLDRVKDVLLSGEQDLLYYLIDTVKKFEGDQGDDLSVIELTGGELKHIHLSDGSDADVRSMLYQTESFPWKFSMCLEQDALRDASIVDQVMAFVGGIKGIELHQEKIFIITSELYSNALEHGVLGLDSKLKDSADGFEEYYRLREQRLKDIDDHHIDLEFSFHRGEPNYVELVLTDSGQGFDYSGLSFDTEENEESHGRGLALLHRLCSRLEYSNEGRTVTAVYNLCLD